MNSTIKKYVDLVKDWNNQSKYMKWIVHYTKPYLPYLILMIGFDVIASLASIATAVISQQIIDGATAGMSIKRNMLFYIGIILASQLISVIASLLMVVTDEKFSFGIRKQIYERILKTNWVDVSKYHTGDLLTRLTSDTDNIAGGISDVIPSVIVFGVQLIATFFTLFYYSKGLALFALSLAPVACIVSLFLGKKLKALQVKVQESESKYRSFMTESLSNLLIIKTFCEEEYSTERLSTLRKERFRWVLKKSRMGLVASTAMSMTFQLGYIVAFAFGALSISRNTISFGTMTIFLTLVNRIQAPLLGLAACIPQIVSVLASAGRVMELQNLPMEEKQEVQMKKKEIGVQIEDLTFGYTDETVLENASMNIKPGEFVAIVGESGIGKTTLIRLIMSFLNQKSGQIFFYDSSENQQKANAGDREFISYVPQGNTLFSGSIEDNVRMGRRNATQEEIIEALQAASALEFVEELPDGIKTVIGEKGYGISEGQAQRIAIARALVRKAPFLILDEATSSLDEKTELCVLENIRRYQPAPTCLLITHRRSVLAYCDREIQIENKKLEI